MKHDKLIKASVGAALACASSLLEPAGSSRAYRELIGGGAQDEISKIQKRLMAPACELQDEAMA